VSDTSYDAYVTYGRVERENALYDLGFASGVSSEYLEDEDLHALYLIARDAGWWDLFEEAFDEGQAQAGNSTVLDKIMLAERVMTEVSEGCYD
jgi:hypothetical protein